MNDTGYIDASHITKMIITFGKYKDKSVYDLMADKKYHCWLINQPWFIHKYPKLHSIIWDNSDIDCMDYYS